MNYESAWGYFYIFFQSNLLEIPVFFLIYRALLSARYTISLVTLSNAFTHPVVIFVFLKASSLQFIEAILVAEAFAIAVESLLHRSVTHLSLLRVLSASLIANLVSWQLGPILTAWVFFDL